MPDTIIRRDEYVGSPNTAYMETYYDSDAALGPIKVRVQWARRQDGDDYGARKDTFAVGWAWTDNGWVHAYALPWHKNPATVRIDDDQWLEDALTATRAVAAIVERINQ
jgi:hypothetical protein